MNFLFKMTQIAICQNWFFLLLEVKSEQKRLLGSRIHLHHTVEKKRKVLLFAASDNNDWQIEQQFPM